MKPKHKFQWNTLIEHTLVQNIIETKRLHKTKAVYCFHAELDYLVLFALNQAYSICLHLCIILHVDSTLKTHPDQNKRLVFDTYK